MTKSFGVLALAACLASSVGGLATAGVVFTRVVDNTGDFRDAGDAFNGVGASINEGGTVAFRGIRASGLVGVYTARPGAASFTTIHEGGSAPAGASYPAINDAGQVAFVSSTVTSSVGIFVGDGGAPAIGIPGTLGGFTTPSINNAGQVSFVRSGPTGGSEVVLGGSGAVTTLATTIGSGFSEFNGVTAINDLGAVAFGATSGGGRGVYLSVGGTLSRVVNLGSAGFGAPRVTSITNSGAIAFESGGLFIAEGGAVRTVAENRPGEFFSNLALNNAGGIAFLGLFGNFLAPDRGIFRGADLVADKIIRTGDALDGSIVVDLEFRSFGLNDSGQVAFVAELADGRRGVYVATVVPEPHSLAMAAIGGVAACLLRTRRNRIVDRELN